MTGWEVLNNAILGGFVLGFFYILYLITKD